MSTSVRRGLRFGSIIIAMVGSGCGSGTTAPNPAHTAVGVATSEVGEVESQGGPRVAFLGDSITAGLNVAAGDAYPAVLAERLGAMGAPIRVINAGRSGDTTAGGLARIDWILAQSPDIVVIELGGNDGLRGQPLEAIERNLRAMIDRVCEAGSVPVLFGMRLPPSYGERYAGGFAALFERIARDEDIAWIPFFMEPVAGKPELNQPDGIHPTVEGHRRIAESLVPAFRALVEGLGGR
ncbi:MAG: arylesterase [Planctomycetes bacterium]|nr:arylesterase [Planctomycetota bacterium]